MDWSKAKNILLILFLILNVCLAVYIFKFKGWDSTRNNILSTQKVLENRGFTLKTAIPNQRKAYKLTYTNSEFDRIQIAHQLLRGSQISPDIIADHQPLQVGTKTLVFESKNAFSYTDAAPDSEAPITDEAKTEQYAREVLTELNLPVAELHVDSFTRNPDKSVKLIFIEKYKNYYIFDNTAEFILTGKGIRSMKCKFVQVKGFTASKVEMVPAYQILLKDFVDGKNKIITDIDLGYESFIENATMESSNNPVWRIRLADGASSYYTVLGEKKQ